MTSPQSADWIRPLGRTGLSVSAVTLGGSGLGSMPAAFGYEVAAEQAIKVVQQAFAGPYRTIDTSNAYSDGESERRIGQAVAGIGGLPADALIITKVDADGEDYSGDRVRHSVAESRERLGLDFLPVVLLHDPEYHDFEMMAAPGGAVETLKELRATGEIGHIGVAGGNTRTLQRYLELGGLEIVLTHNRWTLVDRSAADLLDRAEAEGIAFINAAIYGGGILANAAGTKYAYRQAGITTLSSIARMDLACRQQGVDLATAALQFSVNDPRIATTVVGITKPERLDRLSEALATELPEDLWQTLAAEVPTAEHWLDHV